MLSRKQASKGTTGISIPTYFFSPSFGAAAAADLPRGRNWSLISLSTARNVEQILSKLISNQVQTSSTLLPSSFTNYGSCLGKQGTTRVGTRKVRFDSLVSNRVSAVLHAYRVMIRGSNQRALLPPSTDDDRACPHTRETEDRRRCHEGRR